MRETEERKKETIVKISNAIVGISLAAGASSAAALSLGSSRGAVVLGTPVDLTFNVTPDPGSDVASSCISAKVVSGSTPVSESKVQVTPVQSQGASQVRVRAFITADEPVLTVTLTGGCSGAITRQYTFLAELPESAAAAAASASASGSLPLDLTRLAPSGAQGSGTLAGGAVTGRAASGVASSAATPKRREPAATPSSRAAAQVERRASASPRGGSSAAPAAAPARPRLVMEPLDSVGAWIDSPVTLRTAQELPEPSATTTDAQRAEAAALWRALNTPPEEVQQAAGRITQLEAAAASQRAQVNAERAAAAGLRQRLETVESNSFPAIIVYSLIALLLAALALAYWLWIRARRAAVSAWEHSVQASGYAGGSAVLAGSEGAESLSVEPHPDDQWTPSKSPRMPTPTIRPAGATAAAATAAAAATVSPALAPAPAARPAHHIGEVHPEELFDVQQQAEFFVSVGEHDQAIGVLETYIATHGDSSPTAYLELLRLFHTLSRAEAFNQLSERFQALFNARVPGFSAFHRQGRTLMEYPQALAQIEAIWSTDDVVGLIQTCVVRSDDPTCPEPFDLAAYEDLLLLLAIAQTTPAGQRGLPPPRTRTTPQAGASAVEAATFAAPAVAAPYTGAADDASDPFSLAAVGIQTLPDIHFDALTDGLSLEPRGPSAAAAAQAPAPVPQAQDLGLDLDLSAFMPAPAAAPAAERTPPPAVDPKTLHSPLDDPFDLQFELDPKGPGKTDRAG